MSTTTKPTKTSKIELSPEDERLLAFFGSFFESDEDENGNYSK